jgi:hypothetical protein
MDIIELSFIPRSYMDIIKLSFIPRKILYGRYEITINSKFVFLNEEIVNIKKYFLTFSFGVCKEISY